MILTCPSCGTQYVVKDGAIPPGGRQVRCASCKHSWHQDPEAGAEPAQTDPIAQEASVIGPEAEGAPEDFAEPRDSESEESIAEAVMIEPRSGPEAEERAYEEALVEDGGEPVTSVPPTDDSARNLDVDRASTSTPAQDWREPPVAEAQDDEFSPFHASDEAEPRRRPLVGILLAVLVIAALAAAFWFFAPAEWKARLGLAAATASPLALVTTHMDRQKLESGNELLTVTGRVVNPTGKEQTVPPLSAQLKTRTGQVVYSWTIAPPARTLPPGASASFNSAEVNVPAGGEELTISLGSPNA